MAESTVDQNPIRRRGVGLRALDRERAFDGFTLFTPQYGTGTVLLVDLEGHPVHTWEMPYPPGLHGALTERGTLLYGGKIPGDTFISKAPFGGGVVLEATWDGRVLWELRYPTHHHDARLLSNGNIVLLGAAILPPSMAARVHGGRPGTEVDGHEMWADTVVELTTQGQVVWEWRSWEHLIPEEDAITALQDERHEWTHANAVIELPNGNLVVSFRNISTVVEIERTSGDIIWKLGAPPLSGQHAPELLANGHLLIFDNGAHRLDESFPFSRIIEVDRASKEIVWKYQEPRPYNFYSPRISNAQRLPNGNTLINEGVFGRLFEVTAEGEVVWEYVNPLFGPADLPQGQQNNTIFRAYRYSPEEIARFSR
ncbi:MAG TPA: aryl-sulfate sulfotransferase [Chloroflexota bacterium]|nr:aryl-sulfate sulfotransferase [Chloroflexota bacterium]